MSLRLKMILGIGGILLLVILVYTYIALRRQATHLLNMARREAEVIAAVTDRAISRAMGEGKSQEVEAILVRVGQDPEMAGIRIVDSEGVVLRSSRPEEAGHRLAPEERPSAGKPPEPTWDFLGRTVGVFRAIPNGPVCFGCHPADRATLGFLSVQVAFPAIDSEMARDWSFMILSAIVGLIAAGGLIAVFFTLMVGRRIDAISATMGRLESGDLTSRVPADYRDELGRLGESFNTMVARLADARRQLEDRYAEEIRRRERLASLGQMAAGIAHEINNPLAGMQNCVRTLLKGGRGDRQRTQYLTMLQEGLGRIGRTVGQLLDFAREAKPEMSQTPLPPILQRCMALLEQDALARHVTLTFSPNADLPALLVDPLQIEQVFLNILKNAIEAMPGGGTVMIRAFQQAARGGQPAADRSGEEPGREGAGETAPLHPHPTPPPQFVVVEVSDSGEGIAPEHLPRIFDPFFTTKEVGRGTGLGLSVSYGIVRAHGGSIEVRSTVGAGSTFTVALPVRGADH